jgi:hypothetical protein
MEHGFDSYQGTFKAFAVKKMLELFFLHHDDLSTLILSQTLKKMNKIAIGTQQICKTPKASYLFYKVVAVECRCKPGFQIRGETCKVVQ